LQCGIRNAGGSTPARLSLSLASLPASFDLAGGRGELPAANAAVRSSSLWCLPSIKGKGKHTRKQRNKTKGEGRKEAPTTSSSCCRRRMQMIRRRGEARGLQALGSVSDPRLGLRAWRLVPKGGIFYALTATVPWTDDRIRFDAALLMGRGRARAPPPPPLLCALLGGRECVAIMARWWRGGRGGGARGRGATAPPQLYRRPSFPVFPPPHLISPLGAALLFCSF
jgi:hypothetical protein